MDIRGNPVVFDRNALVVTAIFFNTSFKSVEEISKKIITVNNITFDYLKSHSDVFIQAENQFFVYYNDKIYTNYIHNPIYLLIMSYVYVKYGETDIKNVISKYQQQEHVLHEIKNYSTQIIGHQRKISEYINRITPYEPFNYNDLLKACKHYKVKIKKDGTSFKLDFGKCMSGNELEGHIQYKSIVIWLTVDMGLTRLQYHFSNFYYDTLWDLSGVLCLHPHINCTEICYGNRSDDFVSYVKGKNYDFLIDLLKETFNSYNPSGPFLSVSKIAKFIKYIQKNIPLAKLESYDSDAEKSKRLFQHACRCTTKCDLCGDYIVDSECCNEECLRNSSGVHNCQCGTQMVWDSTTRIFKCPTCYYCNNCQTRTPNSDHCKNTNCSHSPLYIIYCIACGEQLVKNNGLWGCGNIKCWTNTTYQSTPHPDLTSSPICKICGNRHMQQNSQREWYCNINNHSISQYDRAGALLNTRRIMEYIRVWKRAVENHNLLCPYCDNVTVLTTDGFYCERSGCRNKDKKIYDTEGQYQL